MAESPQPNPENELARYDPGDETANRYRFQWTCAAVVYCMLLDETEDVVEVFCEHHEDVLLKHRDGSFTGHQVKTRDDGQPLGKAKDDAVLGACARFAKLDALIPSILDRAFKGEVLRVIQDSERGAASMVVAITPI